MEKKIIKFGHEYTLVEAERGVQAAHLPEPCFMGYKGWVLKSVKKVKEDDVAVKMQNPEKLTRTKRC